MQSLLKSYLKILILFVLGSSILMSCSQVHVDDYQNTTPKLDLKTFFSGKLKAYGILQNRSGKVTRHFTADIDASWEGNTGTLDEKFYFNDGEVDTRVWTLTQNPDGSVSGTAGDVVGTAKGQVSGFAMNWVYTLTVPYKDSTIDVKVDDWLYLVSENRLLNRSDLKKFGFKVGELFLVIEKVE